MSKLKNFLSFIYHSSSRLSVDIYMHSTFKNLKIRRIIDILLIPLGLLDYLYLMMSKKNLNDYKYNISVVTIVKNEASYIEEWINYYLSIGVDHFYIYDNDSTDNLKDILSKPNLKKRVTYKMMSGRLRQLDAYNDALNMCRNVTKYVAVVDADEFIYCPGGDHTLYPVVDSFLDKKEIGGLAVNWLIYGSSNFEHRPKGLVTNNYLYRSKVEFEKNRHIKTICNPRKTFNFTITHHPNYLPGFYAINENFVKITGSFTDNVSVKKINIHHYYSKSKEEFLMKRERGAGDVMNKRRLAEFDEHNRNDVFDDSICKYNKQHNLG